MHQLEVRLRRRRHVPGLTRLACAGEKRPGRVAGAFFVSDQVLLKIEALTVSLLQPVDLPDAFRPALLVPNPQRFLRPEHQGRGPSAASGLLADTTRSSNAFVRSTLASRAPRLAPVAADAPPTGGTQVLGDEHSEPSNILSGNFCSYSSATPISSHWIHIGMLLSLILRGISKHLT